MKYIVIVVVTIGVVGYLVTMRYSLTFRRSLRRCTIAFLNRGVMKGNYANNYKVERDL